LVALGADVSSGELWYIKPESLHGRAMGAAGVRNAISGGRSGPPTLPVEELVRLDPEVIVVISADPTLDAAGRDALVAGFASLPTLTAVKGRRVGVLAGFKYLSPGPSILDFVDALHAEVARLASPR